MPIVVVGGREGEGEEERLSQAAGSRELSRITSNLTLAEHMGRFMAGEVIKQFQHEDL